MECSSSSSTPSVEEFIEEDSKAVLYPGDSQTDVERKDSGTRNSVEFAEHVERNGMHEIIDDTVNNSAGEQKTSKSDDTDGMKDNSSGNDSETESEVDIGVKRDVDDSSSGGSTEPLDNDIYPGTHPKITQGFRPEMADDDPLILDSRTSKRSVSFTPKPSDSANMDGDRNSMMVTIDTQTDWDWVTDAIDLGLSTTTTPKEGVEEEWTKDKSDLRSILVKPDSREATSMSKPDTPETTLDDRNTFSAPYTPYSDEFGIPIMDISSDSDSSDEDSHRSRFEDHNLLPSVGPPQILQYIRESEQDVIDVEDPEARLKDNVDMGDYPVDEFGHPVGMFGGMCEFCGELIKPFPSLERQKQLPASELFCCEEYRDFVQFATTTALELEEEAKHAHKLISIQPHAHFGTKQDRKMAKERAVMRMRERELQRRQHEATGLQHNVYNLGGRGSRGHGSNGSHTPHGSHTPRQAQGGQGGQGGHGGHTLGAQPTGAHGGGAISKHSAQPSGGTGVTGATYKDMAATNRSSGMLPGNSEVARQMKTINYQLSSQRCLEEGWTLRPPSPLDDDDEDIEVFIPEPITSPRHRSMISKFYKNGKKFLTIFPDGSGNVFYPNGQIAIIISYVSLGQYVYIIHDDTPTSQVMAVFEPNGYGSCYYKNGNVRLFLDQLGGIEMNYQGDRRKKWKWKDSETHIHAPPFQPICLSINEHVAVRVMTQENIALTFAVKSRSCRFNIGSKLKLVAPENIPPQEIEEADLFLEECKVHVESILDRVATLLKFPKSPKLGKILPPIHITSKMQRTQKLRREKDASGLTDSGVKPSRNKVILPTISVN